MVSTPGYKSMSGRKDPGVRAAPLLSQATERGPGATAAESREETRSDSSSGRDET